MMSAVVLCVLVKIILSSSDALHLYRTDIQEAPYGDTKLCFISSLHHYTAIKKAVFHICLYLQRTKKLFGHITLVEICNFF